MKWLYNAKEIEFDKDSFERWWHEEGSRGPTEEQAGMDQETFIQIKTRQAWLNGADQAREKLSHDNYMEEQRKEK